jgi:hypothetical protein
MADLSTTRRGMLGAMALAPMVLVAPASAISSPSPFRVAEARYRAATEHFNRVPTSLI